jgi:filamentous hemagglutinin family protein
MAFAPAAFAGGALPQCGQFVNGQGSIAGSSHALVITQPGSTRGVIDWRSFSIGNGNSVAFNNGSGATLNRVTGGDPSSILGTLTATGSLYLINPQGIVVGTTGVVTTGGRFVASTLNASPDAFMRGGPLTLNGQSNASVINFGQIGSTGGDVFLIARQAVKNYGLIDAPHGSAELAVGQQVLLQDSSSSKQAFVQVGSGGTVLDAGQIRAAQASLQAADGNVYALAAHIDSIRATGTATRDGHVWLVAEQGKVNLRGPIAAINADGLGGTVETTGTQVSFGAVGVGLPTVEAGLWKVAAPSFTIGPAAAGAFARSLNAGTAVNVETTGANGHSGDLTVASNLQWQGGASLTLAAYRNLTIARKTTLNNTGSGNLTLRADASGIDNNASITNRGTIDWSGSTGIVSALYDINGSFTPGTLRSNTAWTAAPYSGLLTQVTAYKLVNSLTDLQNVSLDLAGIYALGKDIDASATSGPSPSVVFTPIGNGGTPFSGQFDGMGHAIDRLRQPQAQQPIPVGMFGVIGGTGVVRNVGVTNSFGPFDAEPGPFGLLAGQNQGLITYVYTTGSQDIGAFESGRAGGLVGRNDGIIERSWSSAFLGYQGLLGGLVGVNYGTISQSYATGTVSGGIHARAGGLVGDNYGTVSQSYATGTTGTIEPGAGGLVQTNQSSGVITQSFATGPVPGCLFCGPGFGAFGGIASNNAGTIATNVYWDKDTTTRTQSAGSGAQLPASNGLTTAQMSNPASFDPSWNFTPTGTWAMPAGATHPVLRWQLEH